MDRNGGLDSVGGIPGRAFGLSCDAPSHCAGAGVGYSARDLPFVSEAASVGWMFLLSFDSVGGVVSFILVDGALIGK